MAPLRIGTLGAARITPGALIKPARRVDDVEVVAVAARDRDRAAKFAAKHGIARVHGSYEALIDDPDVDAVYNPLPNGLHGKWTIAALEAGKHVLCEKPFTANADEARTVAAVAARTGLVCMEAFHYRYHPLAQRLVEIAHNGEIGTLTRVETTMAFPLVPKSDIRWDLRLAGGAAMDVGCYALHLVRSVTGAEPQILSAAARERSPDVDRSMRAELSFSDDVTASIRVSMLSSQALSMSAKVFGTAGTVKVLNPWAPQHLHRFTVQTPHRTTHEKFSKDPTYLFQLRAFAGAVLRGEPILTDTADAIANMTAIDACYEAAGLPLRQPT